MKLFKVFRILIFVLIAGFTSQIFSQTDDGGPIESAQLPIWIKNNSGTPMANTTVKIVVNTQALVTLGLMQADGDDIRFASTCGASLGTVLTYWLEGPMNSPNTVIWVRVPAVTANDSALIYMYFGNPSISSGSSPFTTLLSGPNSSTDSVSNGTQTTGVANCQRGFRFTANADIYVTHLGRREPLGVTRYISLFDFNSQALLRQKQISGPAAQYSYDTLGSPIWLNSGQQYLLEMFGDGTNFSYYFNGSTTLGQYLTYGDMRYCNGCTQNTFPTTTLANNQYGYPDFWYWFPANSVTPGPTLTYYPPADTVTPTAPAGLTGIPGSGSAQLRWNKNPQFDVWKYFIYRNTTNTPGTSTLIDSTTHPDTAYVAGGLTNGTTYYFWVRAVDRFCQRRTSAYSTSVSVTPFVGIQANGNEIPKVYALYQNFPNPFNPTTNINFDVPRVSMTRITVYDLLGREVDVLANEVLAAGKYNINFNASNLSSGVYFYKIESGDFVDKRKMIIVK